MFRRSHLIYWSLGLWWVTLASLKFQSSKKHRWISNIILLTCNVWCYLHLTSWKASKQCRRRLPCLACCTCQLKYELLNVWWGRMWFLAHQGSYYLVPRRLPTGFSYLQIQTHRCFAGSKTLNWLGYLFQLQVCTCSPRIGKARLQQKFTYWSIGNFFTCAI